jgi:hypothetical protein
MILLLLLLAPAELRGDAWTWQLRAGLAPSGGRPSLISMTGLLMLDLGAAEELAGSIPDYATPSVAELAATAPDNLEELLRDRMRAGDRTALVPIVTMLVREGEPGRAAVYMEGRGLRLPANRRDLAMAAAWYGRYDLGRWLAARPDPPPDMGGDDVSGTVAAVLAAGWMPPLPGGLFHPRSFVTQSDLAVLGASLGLGRPPAGGVVWLDDLDAWMRSSR